MALQLSRARKPVLKQLREKVLVFRDCHQTIAYVAGRQHVEFAAQASAGAAVVAHRYDCGQIGNVRGRRRNLSGCHGVSLESFEEGRKTSAATDSHETKSFV